MTVAVEHFECSHHDLVRLLESIGLVQRQPRAELQQHFLLDFAPTAERLEELVGRVGVTRPECLERVELFAELVERIELRRVVAVCRGLVGSVGAGHRGRTIVHPVLGCPLRL